MASYPSLLSRCSYFIIIFCIFTYKRMVGGEMCQVTEQISQLSTDPGRTSPTRGKKVPEGQARTARKQRHPVTQTG